jgi:hypothetical protein
MPDYQNRNRNMLHLPTERLAALADEAPTSDELAHLASCEDCARERAAFRALAAAATAESATIGKPLTSWESLRPALIADGVIDDGRVLRFNSRARRPWLQVAAAVLLIAAGVMGGRYSANGTFFANSGDSPVASAPAAPVADTTPKFASIEDARAAQERSQMIYQSATAFIAQRDTAPSSSSAIRTRLAALDRASEVMGEAMNQAPNDPVISGYYLTTLGQREATLRQLNAVAPASMRITSY